MGLEDRCSDYSVWSTAERSCRTGAIRIFSVDGRLIASGSLDRTVRIWDEQTSSQVGPALLGHSGPISSLTFSLNGAHVFGATPNEQLLWDINKQAQAQLTSEELEELELGASNARSPFMHVLNNGLVVGIDNKELFWIPANHRGPWCSFGNRLVLGGRQVTMIDISSIAR